MLKELQKGVCKREIELYGKKRNKKIVRAKEEMRIKKE